LAGFDGLWPVFPKPAHGIRKKRCPMFAIVRAFSPDVLDLISGKRKRTLKGLVRHPPVAAVAIIIIRAVLQKDSNRFRLVFADERGVSIAPTQSHVGSDGAENAAELIRTFPGRRESADRTARRTTDGPVIAISGETNGKATLGLLLLDF